MKKQPDSKNMKKIGGVSKKIRKGDQVMALTGNNKGLTGNVLAIDGEKVLVQGLNVCKKHTKPSELYPKGGIIERERPIHVSNLRVCVDGTPVKLKSRDTKDGGRELFYMKGDEAVSYRVTK